MVLLQSDENPVGIVNGLVMVSPFLHNNTMLLDVPRLMIYAMQVTGNHHIDVDRMYPFI